ncbi:MAG: GNAT family N-acetyltransferase [Acidimicrobiales bacterium]
MQAGPVSEDEIDATLDTDELGFGSRMPTHEREIIKRSSVVDRIVASRDGKDLVGTAVSVPAEMTLPGAVVEPVAAIVGVAVWPTHRRQGRLRSMMRYQLDDLRERGDYLAVLTSSEARIYQRFGYGPATLGSGYTLDKRDLKVVGDASGGWPAPAGNVRIVDLARAMSCFPQVFSSYQATRPGEVSRLDLGWAMTLGRPVDEDQRDRFFVEFQESDAVTGYAVYRIVANPTEWARRAVRLVELCAATPAAYVALWSYLVDIDLTPTLETGARPVDEPIRWALSDYRRMRTMWTSEHTFVRLVDVARALAARRYHDAGELTLAVDDPFCAWNSGTYRLSAGGRGGEATVERTGGAGSPGDVDAADLALDVSALGSIYLGGLRPGALATIGLVSELRPGALDRADRMFVGPRPPFCSTQF